MSILTAPQVPAPAVPDRPPNRLTELITGRTYLSHSQLSTMRSCPRKFAFQYVEKAPADFIPASLIFGGSIHSALELYFRARLEGMEVTPGAMLSAYHDGWKRQRGITGIHVPVRFGKDQTDDSLNEDAQSVLEMIQAR